MLYKDVDSKKVVDNPYRELLLKEKVSTVQSNQQVLE